MVDVANLSINVRSDSVVTADNRLDNLTRSATRTERATDGLGRSFARLAGPLAAVAGSIASIGKLVSVTREFGVLNAQLITATGSAEDAAKAFEAIQDFASTTPFDVQQVTDSFTKLVNLGLEPSERALESYGNTASAMGKDLNQLIEAVADASTNEFERLKEFGIKAKQQGDEVAFTFRGITTTVQKNAAEIEGYLIALGENEFAGAMAERAETLDGALSNLGDTWDALFLTISEQGIGDLITDGVRLATDALSELNDLIASGQIPAYLDAVAVRFDNLTIEVQEAIDFISDLIVIAAEQWASVSGQSVDSIIDSFSEIPESIKAIIQIAGVEIAVLVDYARTYGEAFVDVFIAEANGLVAKAAVLGNAVGAALNPFDSGDFDVVANINAVAAETDKATNNILQNLNARTEAIRNARFQSIDDILTERQTALDSFDAQIDKADELRKKYEENRAARRASGEDRLARFGIERPEQEEQVDEKAAAREAKRLARLQAAREKEFENLRLSLRTEEEVIQESYDNRLAIIKLNTEEASELRRDLTERLNQEFATSALGDLAEPDTFEEEIEALNEFYNRRRELILANVELTEQQRTELETQLTEQRNQKLAQLEMERAQESAAIATELSEALLGITSNFASEQSQLYRVMFAASKAFAVAEAGVKIQQAIATAAATPFPQNLAAMSTVFSATAGILSTIRGQNFAGAFDEGGMIPSGKVGIVGEYGPELVSGPAKVTSRKDTESIIQQAAATPAAAPQTNIRIINSVDPEMMNNYLGSAAGEETILNVLRSNPEIVQSVASGEAR